jgi:hypothetical protein
MRVFFNLANSAGSIPDSDGLEVIDLDDAYAQAKQAIAEILQENEPMKADMVGWRLDAVDSTGTVLFSIDFDSVID